MSTNKMDTSKYKTKSGYALKEGDIIYYSEEYSGVVIKKHPHTVIIKTIYGNIEYHIDQEFYVKDQRAKKLRDDIRKDLLK